MINKKFLFPLLIIISIILLILLGSLAYLYFTTKWDVKPELNPDQILEIAKTDKDYAELKEFTNNFSPVVVNYKHFSPTDYEKIKPEWEKQGLEDRLKLIDQLSLTNSTYWVELINKNDESKGLRMVFDIKENKSLLLIASMSVSAGVGI